MKLRPSLTLTKDHMYICNSIKNDESHFFQPRSDLHQIQSSIPYDNSNIIR